MGKEHEAGCGMGLIFLLALDSLAGEGNEDAKQAIAAIKARALERARIGGKP